MDTHTYIYIYIELDTVWCTMLMHLLVFTFLKLYFVVICFRPGYMSLSPINPLIFLILELYSFIIQPYYILGCLIVFAQIDCSRAIFF